MNTCRFWNFESGFFEIDGIRKFDQFLLLNINYWLNEVIKKLIRNSLFRDLRRHTFFSSYLYMLCFQVFKKKFFCEILNLWWTFGYFFRYSTSSLNIKINDLYLSCLIGYHHPNLLNLVPFCVHKNSGFVLILKILNI